VQELNPLVQVNCITKPLRECPQDFFDKFNVICLISASKELQVCVHMWQAEFPIEIFLIPNFVYSFT